MRNRLIKILDNIQDFGTKITEKKDKYYGKYTEEENTSNEIIADCLLEDGWMRPPCKVGQTIYYNFYGKIFNSKCQSISIHENDIQIHLYDFDGNAVSYSAKDIYTSKEEAKRALKGGNVN